ncbi:class I SAM-dependent methyltransferase [Oscillatoriales cyanobacterium LEGE 11467]|uniref:Class I SAM-dependent methyltransferase n=1 Tax=Zarconia navalis LEGE 11467 TaxID=1828826 RepID=A0A928W155_9CYAN|nr:class I SAM-dependent methyltransferase [Zarconia navalis]MBE9041375.1 class I SAM-dependent methyltransferase [Zarconia navalis LEGE 11467]
MNRRVNVLVDRLSGFIPETQPLQGLDVGCGSGEIAYWLTQKRSNINLQGVDVLVRSQTQIPVREFDGLTLPFPNKHFDFVMLVDVLHHTEYPEKLMAECARVTRQFLLIKDHYCNGWWDNARLRLMDWVGNCSYGVALPYNYQSTSQWQALYDREQLITEKTLTQLHLYPPPVGYLFDSNLHFISRLQREEYIEI